MTPTPVDDEINMQVVLEKDETKTRWGVKEFVVLHQPEPWSPVLLNNVFQYICQYNNPPDMIVWHEKPFIKVSVLKY
jgi:hypothetical protein